MKGKLEKALCMVGLLAFLCVAAYFAGVRRGPVFQGNGHWVAWPGHVTLPEPAGVFFGPLHEWDRTVLRPGFWAGTIPPAELRQQKLLLLEVLRRDLQAAAKQE